MPASQYSLYNFVAAGAASPVATEGVIGTTRTVSSSYPGCVFAVEFGCDYVTGTGVTGVVFRIRRDSLTGTLIYTGPLIPIAASTVMPHQNPGATDSIVGEVAGQLYVLTVAQAGGTGAGQATNVFSKVTVAE